MSKSLKFRNTFDAFSGFDLSNIDEWFFYEKDLQLKRDKHHDYFVANSIVKNGMYTLNVNVAGCNTNDVRVRYRESCNVILFDFVIKDKTYTYDVVVTNLVLEEMSCVVKDGILTVTAPVKKIEKPEFVEVEVK